MKLLLKVSLIALGGVFVVFSGWLLVSCGCFPPPNIPWSQVNVAYVGPLLSPSSDLAYFIKVVTQEKKVKVWAQTGPMDGGYEDAARRLWTKTFLCRSKK